MHQITLFQDKKSKNFLPDPTRSGEEDTSILPTPHPRGAYGASILGPTALYIRPLFESPESATVSA